MLAGSIRAMVFGLAAATLLPAADLTDEDKERFLREARVVSIEDIQVGITLSRRVTLSDDTLTHDAHLQDVDTIIRRTGGARDSYRYNILAYRLDRLLDLGMIPVSVEREHDGRPSAFTWWIDDILMPELERWKKGLAPPDKDAWNDQMYQARVFNALVYNSDSNLGNVVIDKRWKIWLIDFTRAFRLEPALRSTRSLGRIDRRVWRNLQRLDEQTLHTATGSMLLESERQALLARREALITYFRQRIAAEGEAAVLCDLPGH